MKILVTRPEPDASRLGARLKAMGHEPVLEPLMSVKYLEADADFPGALERAQAIAFTSANGVRALARRSKARHLPVFAVGAATAKAARDEGFETVHVAGGDVDTLADEIATTLDPAGGSIVHIAATNLAGDLAGALGSRGFEISRHVLYEASSVETLSEAVRADLEEGAIDAVLIYSPRTGRILAALMEEAGLLEAAKALTCYCLSANVAQAAASIPFARCPVAATPDEDALIALLS